MARTRWKTWEHGSELRYVKNPLWPDADSVQIEVIQGPIIESESTAMSMYEANEIDMLADPGWGPPLPDMDRIKADAALGEELFIAPRTCTYYYGFVNAKPPFDDPLVRKAFAAAIDRQSLIDNRAQGRTGACPHALSPPATSATPPATWTSRRGWSWTTTPPSWSRPAQWIAEAGYPDGEGLEATLMHNTSEAHAQVAQAVQAMWAEAFPQATISIENQEWQVYLNTLLPDAPLDEKPNIYRLGWCADFPDAANWLSGVFRSNSDQNYADVQQPRVRRVWSMKLTRVPTRRCREDLYAQAEKILIEDATAIAPIYYYTYVRMYKPWLTNVVISPVTGDPIAQWTIDMDAKNAARGE